MRLNGIKGSIVLQGAQLEGGIMRSMWAAIHSRLIDGAERDVEPVQYALLAALVAVVVVTSVLLVVSQFRGL